MAAWTTRPGSNIKNVDPALRDIMETAAVQFAKENPGYSVVGISGKKARSTGTKQHPAGLAVDVSIVGPNGPLPNRANARTFRTYEKFAQIARQYQQAKYPALKDKFGWGGYFQQGVSFDQMHFDINRKVDKRGRQNTAYGQWETGLTKAGLRALPGAESIGMNAFPPAPSGPTGWPTPPEKGPGIYGALNPATRAQQYAAAGNRRAYEQGFRPAPAATPQDFSAPVRTTPAQGYGQMAYTLDAAGVPRLGLSPAMISDMALDKRFGSLRSSWPTEQTVRTTVKGTPMQKMPAGPTTVVGGTMTPALAGTMAPATIGAPGTFTAPAPATSPVYGAVRSVGGTMTPSLYDTSTPQAAPTQARVGTPTAPAMNISPTAPVASQLASPSEALRVGAPSVPSLAPSAPFSPVGPYATAAVPTTPASTPSQVVNPAVRDAAAVATPSAYPDEGRFSMKKGLTPEDRKQMGLPPAAPALVQRPAVKEAPIKEVQPAEQVTTTPVRTVTAPTIAPAAPPPEQVGGLLAALKKAAEPVTDRLTAPFHTLANLAGPVPNPKSFDYGTGAQAIGDALSGVTQSKPGAVSYSQSTPGYSIKSLGNGMVEKTNQYGHKSYERVGTPGSGILSGQPTTGGLLSNFGMPGLGATAGGLLSGRNLGGFAGSLLGGAIAGPFGALAGGWLGNKLGSNLGGTAPAAGGGLFGGFGGFGGGGSTSTGGGKRGGTSSGGKGSMSAGSGGMSKSTRY